MIQELKKYNFGCGVAKIDGFVNVDIDEALNPDLVADFLKPLPIEDEAAKLILFAHVIEHLDRDKHIDVLTEFRRILHPDGLLVISYPEFVKCAENYIKNAGGMREHWAATIYGRGHTPFDRHVTPMYTPEFCELLSEIGFKDIIASAEPEQEHNTVVKAKKGERLPTYEEHINQVIFGVK